MTIRLRIQLLLINILLFSAPSIAGQATIAVAANFAAPMKVIAERFERQTDHQLQLIYGSSGKLFAQVQNGAPFDIFLSADTEKPQALIDAGNAVADSRFTYAIGTLVLWSATIDGNALAALKTGQFSKLAVANPRLAPYGAAAIAVLDKLGLAVTVKDKQVMGENIAQTYQFVQSGNAQLGFVALSQVIDDGKVPNGAWVVPAQLHTPIRQDAVLLQRGATNAAAMALLDFLRSEEVLAIIQRYGYTIEPTP